MRIYSDTITEGLLHTAASGILRLADVAPITGARVRRSGWRVVTTGNGPRYKNTGIRGAEHAKAATWDDHGRWMARLFILDPRAVVGPYKGVEDFNTKTGGRYTAAVVLASSGRAGEGR